MGNKQYNLIADAFSTTQSFGRQYVVIPTMQKLTKMLHGNILDVGCGSGTITREIARTGNKKIVGIDISDEMIRIAKEHEKSAPLKIKYYCEDILKFKTDLQFDYIVSVYLLNYAETKKELEKMFRIFFNTLSEKGNCYMLTFNPAMTPSTNPAGDCTHTNPLGKSRFDEGDQIKTEVRKNGKTISFAHYYHSKTTYENAAKKAGFKKISWAKPFASAEAINKFGKSFCDDYLKATSAIIFICEK
jgi:toxoflavin synthase